MTKPSLKPRHFGSDNYAGMCPEAVASLLEANHGHEVSYGDDSWTDKASNLLRQVFETDCEVFFVFNGTSANSLSLASLCQSYHSILCHEWAHVEGSECGAPEFFANGTKVLLLPGANGKIDPKSIEKAVNKRTDIHYPKPKALSLTQATEVGTVYSLAELRELSEVARHFNLRVQMDGARFANAVVSLGLTPKELTWEVGVDVFFQAEDGIRDYKVTGVQTCALPIWPAPRSQVRTMTCSGEATRASEMLARSEERRVGKECRSRGSADHYEKKSE